MLKNRLLLTNACSARCAFESDNLHANALQVIERTTAAGVD